MSNSMQIVKDLANKKIKINRKFDAPKGDVWRAWTESELLDQWWAPKPWKAETKSQEFRNGGHWLYAMVSPEGAKHWAIIDYSDIQAPDSFRAADSFCDEHGNKNDEIPGMHWKNEFHAVGEGTEVVVEISFKREADIATIIEMGFEAGFTAALTNLDQYLSTHFKIRKELKQDNTSRVTTYLNFPGTTEEAFNFYQQVFNGTFTGNGLRHFGDVEMPAGTPPMSEADQKLIIHAELTILGNHVLMATDAPESMGFKMEHGNNMHICVEPDSREEAERLFDALSAGGKVTMPMEDMFWGAYFGMFTDRFGINWMLNFQPA